MSHHPGRRLGAGLLVLAVAVGAAGCGQDDERPADGPAAEVSATEHNDADVDFASDMLQHHAQALSMVDLTLERPLRPEVQELAEQIREAQAPEIQLFTEWLTDWDEEVPETMRDHANAGHDSGHAAEDLEGTDGMATDMPGMMSADDMAALESAPDAAFETMWLEMMVEHHEGAIEMAEDHAEAGRYEPAVDLAQDIADSQAVEVETMEALLEE